MASVEIAGRGEPSVVDDWLVRYPQGRRALVVEGLFALPRVPPDVATVRLAPGCVCCIGQLPLRVALMRLVRQHRPEHVLLVLSDLSHRAAVETLIADPRLGLRPPDS